MTDRRLDVLLGDVSRPYRRISWLAILCAGGAAMAGILLLGLSGWFITGAALAGAAGLVAIQAFNYLLPSAAIRLLAIVRTGTRYGERLFAHEAALRALAAFRVRLFAQLITRPMPDLGRNAGDTSALLLQDVDALEDKFMRAPGTIAAIIGALTAIVITIPAGLSAMMALGVIMVSVVLGTRVLSRRWLPPLAIRVHQDIGALKGNVVEYAAASAEIAAYAASAPITRLLQAQAAQLDHSRIAFSRAEALLAATVTGAGGLAMAAVIGLSNASLPLSLLAALAAAGAIEALGASVRSSGRDAVIAAGLGRLAALVETVDHPLTPTAEMAGNTIRFTQNSQTLTFERGDRLVITGRSGSGKTSLLEGLVGLRVASAGGIAIDDRPLADCPPDALRPVFGFSPQDAQLLAGSIGDNLRIARPALTEAMLWRALEVACLSAEVLAMPEGLATWVGDGGVRLSGGQRKRLSLARAILAGRPWLLLDEPSEGLDPATEREMRDNLHDWLDRSGSGLILVTHRAALLSLADRTMELPDRNVSQHDRVSPGTIT